MLGNAIELITRRPVRLALIGMVLIVVGVGLLQNRLSMKAYQDWADTFSQPLLRDTFLIVSDVERLDYAFSQVQELENRQWDGTSAKNEAQLALDLIWLRYEDFVKIPLPPSLVAEHALVVANLLQLIDLADALFLKQVIPDDEIENVRVVSKDVRIAAVILVEEYRSLYVDTLAEKRLALSHSILRSNAFVLFSGALIIIVIMLLGREVVARKAQQSAEAKARVLAYKDSLTGIPNRHAFKETIEVWSADQQKRCKGFTLALIDLDKFKEINDTLGHDVGDKLLKKQASRIETATKAVGGFASRLSGDEFAVLLPFVDVTRINTFCSQMLDKLRQPIDTDIEKIASQGTLGLCSSIDCDGSHESSWGSMQRAADFALYSAKREARGTYRHFDATLSAKLDARRTLLSELPDAVKNGQITPFFQPKVDIATGEVCGFEALARWKRGDDLVPTGEFISLAEEAGFIEEIDIAILGIAASKIADCNALRGTQYKFSSNLSANNFARLDLVEQLRDAVCETGLSPEFVTLEITESMYLSDWGRADMVVRQLRELGFRISLDDFGTGFSSLSYLRTVVADEVKIDRSFVEELEVSEEARFLLDMIIDLAHGLHMDIVVEGIETPEQEALVHAMGCKVGQGYLYGKPMTFADALEIADQRRAVPVEPLRQNRSF